MTDADVLLTHSGHSRYHSRPVSNNRLHFILQCLCYTEIIHLSDIKQLHVLTTGVGLGFGLF